MRLGKALAVGVVESSGADEEPAAGRETDTTRQDVSAGERAAAAPRSDVDQQAAASPTR